MSVRCVALLSGGKDSVMAAEAARQHGHDVVAALVLRPSGDDAWMFHTPNIALAPDVAACMGLPAIEAACRVGEQEEVDDLAAALKGVQRSQGVEAVVAGALASEYQRTRIERVAHRLGLRTFMPLWHKEPAGYVRTFLAPGWDVRFSRVASDGMGATWAGRRFDAGALQDLARLPRGPHLAGEGGEYETLVLAAPGWRRRLVVDAAHTEASASRATWVVDRWHTEPVQSTWRVSNP